MAQVFYVAQDEEIFSIIERLRSSGMLENVFVVPKRALILGSGVNLRLLAREAEKSGKRVTIVTQDDEGRMLAEKAGVPTKPYSDETIRESGPGNRSGRVVAGRVREDIGPEETSEDPVRISASSIGSESFLVTHEKARQTNGRSPVRIPVRDRPSRRPLVPESSVAAKPFVAEPSSVPFRMNGKRTGGTDDIPASAPSFRGGRERDRLADLFRVSDEGYRSPSSSPTKRRQAVSGRSSKGASISRRNPSDPGVGSAHSWFLFFSGVSVLFLVGTVGLILLPKAEVDIVPKSVSKSKEIMFAGRTGTAPDGQEIPVRVVEYSEDVSVTVDASGPSSSSGQKATGNVVIYNTFSSSEQSLVATTRLESSDGKIFRISKGVTVPGMTSDGNPGAVEVQVVADEAGEAYNIGPSDFTIPGFKGNPKFGKFSAKSSEPMRGGASGGGSGIPTVSEADLKTASEQAERIFRDRFESELENRSEGDERFASGAISVSHSGGVSLPETGFVTASFEYRGTFTGKAFLFSEGELRRKASDLLGRETVSGISYSVEDLTVEYLESDPGYGNGDYPLPVRVTALFVADVDLGSLRDDLIGRRLDDMEAVLGKHPEIERLDISWPLPTSLPKKVRQFELNLLRSEP